MPRVRIHQHVNPLSPYYRQEPESIDLGRIFAHPDQPLFLDIGCARGRFLLRMAEQIPDVNFLGIEIREPLVHEANRLADEARLDNLHYAFCNAMLWLGKMLDGLPDGILKTVTIQFPDPWFKKRHAKRRMVNPEMVETIVKHLAPDGKIFVQTDIESLAEEMFELFRANDRLREIATQDNPFPVKTEREKAVEDRSLPVYRIRFSRR